MGGGWNFDKLKDRRAAIRLVKETKPYLLIGSPMCTWFSTMMNVNLRKMPPEKVRKEVKRAIRHMKFVCSLYELQSKEGRYFLDEHPAGASSWKLSCIRSISSRPEVEVTIANMYAYGMKQRC